jgi:hypothetical protein
LVILAKIKLKNTWHTRFVSQLTLKHIFCQGIDFKDQGWYAEFWLEIDLKNVIEKNKSKKEL